MALQHMIKPVCCDTRPTCFQQSRCGGISVPKKLLLTAQVLPLPCCFAESPSFHLHFLSDDRSSDATAASLSECTTPGFVLFDFCFPALPNFG